MQQTIIQKIASIVMAHKSCHNSLLLAHDLEQQNHWQEMIYQHLDAIEAIEENYLPSGSGFDAGVQVLIEPSDNKQVHLSTSYHVMQCGYYIGWLHYKVIVRPDFVYGIDMKITHSKKPTGISRAIQQDIKSYVADTLADALQQEYDLPYNQTLEG